ncbi:MAG: hypothetical protein WCF26_10625 [Candidatus Sulfotelmatobacter sp.]
MCLRNWCAVFLLLFATGVCAAGNSVVPTTTLAAQTANNTSAANSFTNQTNGNSAAGNVSKVDVHSLLYSGADTKVYAHLLLWFGGSNHMNVGYSSNDSAQVHRQITDMISRGIQGVIIDWYGPNNSIDQATKLVVAEAETHPGFTFAIMIDQGAIEWDSCSGCSPQQALIQQLQYIEQTYFPSPAYMTWQGKPVVTNFNIDLSYAVDWNAVTGALSSQPVFIFQNNNGFSHALSSGSYSWVMPTTSDYGMSYLTSFYDTGMLLENEQTVGASYKGFNDTLASWGSNRIMSQQCGQTWLQTFSEINGLYNSGKQLAALQLVTWNDYEEATEIESGISNCFSVTASVSGNSLQWNVNGDEKTVDHYVAYISPDGQNLMSLGEAYPGNASVNLCSYSVPNGSYISYVQAVGKPSINNQMSGAVKFTLNCAGDTSTNGNLTLGANPSALTISAGKSGKMTVTVTPRTGSFNDSITLTCSGLPADLSCSFSPESVTPGASVASSVLTVTSAAVTSMYNGERRAFFFASGLFSFGLMGITIIGKINRRRMIALLGGSMLLALILFASSCGRGGGSSAVAGSSTGTYVVTIKGNAGSTQLSTTVLVTVK